jgi:hypothetical protein
MAITTLDGLIAAARQRVLIQKTASMTATTGGLLHAVHHLAGNPGAGTLSAGNTANGVVPTDATSGFPAIGTFGGGATGYISRIQASNSVLSTLVIYDRLFHCGAYACPQTRLVLASQPSYSTRVPGGTDFTGLELWVEGVTAVTGNMVITVEYTDQDGNAGATTGAISTGIAPILGRMINIPLAAGDSGVQKIEAVTCATSTAGTWNLVVMRRLATVRIPVAGFSDILGWDRTGLPQIFDNSALCIAVAPDSTATGLPMVMFDVVNG